MAFVVRDQEIIPIPIQPGKRVKIGCAYEPPQINYVEYDQLWVQDIMAFGKTPWSWVRWKVPEWIFWFVCWSSFAYALGVVAKRYWQ
jgi:hypothetical protein